MKECNICGHSFDKDEHEYCPNCDGDENFQDDDKVEKRFEKQRGIIINLIKKPFKP